MMKEELQMMVRMAMEMDYRLQVHTLTLLGDVYTHQEHKCPMCIANHIISFQQE